MARATQRSTLVGVFDECDNAEHALTVLHEAGFRYDQIGLAQCSGEVTEQEDALATARIDERGLYAVLVEMGVSEHEARFYEREFEASRAIVTVKPEDRADDAILIFDRLGARSALGASSSV